MRYPSEMSGVHSGTGKPLYLLDDDWTPAAANQLLWSIMYLIETAASNGAKASDGSTLQAKDYDPDDVKTYNILERAIAFMATSGGDLVSGAGFMQLPGGKLLCFGNTSGRNSVVTFGASFSTQPTLAWTGVNTDADADIESTIVVRSSSSARVDCLSGAPTSWFVFGDA